MKRRFDARLLGVVVCALGFSISARAASVGDYFLVIAGSLKTPLAKDEGVECSAYVNLVPGVPPPPVVGSGPNSVVQRAVISEDGKRYACQLIIHYRHITDVGGRLLAVHYLVAKTSAGATAAQSPSSSALPFKEIQVPAVPAGPQALPIINEDL